MSYERRDHIGGFTDMLFLRRGDGGHRGASHVAINERLRRCLVCGASEPVTATERMTFRALYWAHKVFETAHNGCGQKGDHHGDES